MTKDNSKYTSWARIARVMLQPNVTTHYDIEKRLPTLKVDVFDTLVHMEKQGLVKSLPNNIVVLTPKGRKELC